jgi:hypothetical protein
MRTVRNITVAVDPELYRQTRRIAVEYDTTVTDRVRFLPATSATNIPIHPREKAKSPCMPVRASNLHSTQPLAAKQPATVQDKYFSITSLKLIILNALLLFPVERVLTAVRHMSKPVIPLPSATSAQQKAQPSGWAFCLQCVSRITA